MNDVTNTWSEPLLDALRIIAKRCPRLCANCYWSGTAAIAIEELEHRQSLDLDFHTRSALADLRPFLAELKAAFPGKLRVLSQPDSLGSGFRVSIENDGCSAFVIEVFANYENVDDSALKPSNQVSGVLRITLQKYVRDKVQCLVERTESRDLIDIWAVLAKHPQLEGLVRHVIGTHDLVILTERLLNWTDSELREDLKGYPQIDPKRAIEMRDFLLNWVKEAGAKEYA